MKTLIQLIIIGIVIMCFSSCYTADKAQKAVTKANLKHPEVVAKAARDLYPCTDLLKPDTITTYEDSLVFIECPDSNYNAGDYATVVHRDSIYLLGETKTVRVPVKILVPSKVINNWYEDSAKIKLAAIENTRLKKENEKLSNTNEELKGKLDTRTKYLWWLLALCIGLGVWSLRKVIF